MDRQEASFMSLRFLDGKLREDSPAVVYYINDCSRATLDYVGSTYDFSRRLYEHRGRGWNGTIEVVEYVYDLAEVYRRELYWILKKMTYAPYGRNIMVPGCMSRFPEHAWLDMYTEGHIGIDDALYRAEKEFDLSHSYAVKTPPTFKGAIKPYMRRNARILKSLNIKSNG